MYCTHYIPSVLICICTINKEYYKHPAHIREEHTSFVDDD